MHRAALVKDRFLTFLKVGIFCRAKIAARRRINRNVC
jgi:hypothetical protein